MTRRQRRVPEVGEIWSERVPRRAGARARAVVIEKIVDKNGVPCARVRNLMSRRRSRIPIAEFTRGIITGWYRRERAPRSPVSTHDDDGAR